MVGEILLADKGQLLRKGRKRCDLVVDALAFLSLVRLISLGIGSRYEQVSSLSCRGPLTAALSFAAGAQFVNSVVAPTAPGVKVNVELLSPVDPTASAELGAYMRHTISELKHSWNPSTAELNTERGESEVTLAILPSGKVAELHLYSSAHNVALDKSAWNALLKTTFAPLPHGVDSAPLKIRLHFVVS
jgi:TonB family protein